MTSCWKAWGRVSCAARCPLAQVINLFHFVGWPSYAWGLWVYPASHHLFPTNGSHAQGPWWCVMLDDAILATSVYVIPGFMHCIKRRQLLSGAPFSWDTARQGSGIRLGSRSNFNSGFREWVPLHSSLWISLILVTMICTSCVKYYFLCFS